MNGHSTTGEKGGTKENGRSPSQDGVSLSASGSEIRLEVVSMREIRYSTIHPAAYVLDRNNPTIRDAIGTRPVLAVVDRKVHTIYGADLRSCLEEQADVRGCLVVEGSERAKTWCAVQRICAEAIRSELPRDGVILALGGGVTLDTAGFAASVFRRGVRFVRIPTSLIGLVDVGVGIKQGINVSGKKSIVGSFYPATININDVTFLATLPERHLSCGIAEIIKMAVVRDAQLFATLETYIDDLIVQRFQNSSAARGVLVRAEHLMMQELQPNLFESELRRLPDFGHSFSPSIEAASAWSINHGEAVGLDMLISTAIAVVKHLCPRYVLERLRTLLLRAKLPIHHPVCQPSLLTKALLSVRAHRAGHLNLVVPTEIGEATFLEEVTLENIEAALLEASGGGIQHAGAVSGSWWDASPVRSVA